MIDNGLTRFAEIFRKAIGEYETSDALHADLDNVQPQQLLDNTLALFDFIKSLSGSGGISEEAENRLATSFKEILPTGVLRRGTWEASDEPEAGNYGNSGGTSDALYLGPFRSVLDGHHVTSEGVIQVQIPPAPLTGSRHDLVFLELWKQKVDPITGQGLAGATESVSDETAYPLGYVDGAPVAFKYVFPDVPQILLDSAGEGDAVRFQWQWRIRVVPGAGPAVDHPSVLAREVTGYTYSQAPGDPGLYIAGDGGGASKGDLGTLDGYAYATPLFDIKRTVGDTVVLQAHVTDIAVATNPSFEDIHDALDALSNALGASIQQVAEDLAAHIGASGNVHGTSHDDLSGVQGADPASTNVARNKHVSNLDLKLFYDHMANQDIHGGGGKPHGYHLFTETTTFEVPEGLVFIDVFACGPGGEGGEAACDPGWLIENDGGSGGPGGVAYGRLLVQEGDIINIKIDLSETRVTNTRTGGSIIGGKGGSGDEGEMSPIGGPGEQGGQGSASAEGTGAFLLEQQSLSYGDFPVGLGGSGEGADIINGQCVYSPPEDGTTGGAIIMY